MDEMRLRHRENGNFRICGLVPQRRYVLSNGDEVTHTTERTRKGWVQVASGTVTVNDEQLTAGDGAAIAYEETVTIHCVKDSELLLFDMA